MAGNYIAQGIKQFYTEIKTNGLRVSHQFALQFGGNNKQIIALQQYAPIYVQSAALPGREIVTENAAFFGFPFKVPVNTTYNQTWACTCRADVDMKIRKVFEDWMNDYADLSKNTGGSKGKVPANDFVYIHLLKPDFFANSNSINGGTVETARTYKLEGVFPSSLGNMTLSHSGNEISTFDITFAFQYWYPDDSPDPLA